MAKGKTEEKKTTTPSTTSYHGHGLSVEARHARKTSRRKTYVARLARRVRCNTEGCRRTKSPHSKEPLCQKCQHQLELLQIG